MKVRELTIIIANINGIAAALGQTSKAARWVDGKRAIVIAPDGIMSMSERLLECCNQLKQLIPDTEIRIEGGSDASHCNDE